MPAHLVIAPRLALISPTPPRERLRQDRALAMPLMRTGVVALVVSAGPALDVYATSFALCLAIMVDLVHR